VVKVMLEWVSISNCWFEQYSRCPLEVAVC